MEKSGGEEGRGRERFGRNSFGRLYGVSTNHRVLTMGGYFTTLYLGLSNGRSSMGLDPLTFFLF